MFSRRVAGGNFRPTHTMLSLLGSLVAVILLLAATPTASAQFLPCNGQPPTIFDGTGTAVDDSIVIIMGVDFLVDGLGGFDAICVYNNAANVQGGIGDDKITVDSNGTAISVGSILGDNNISNGGNDRIIIRNGPTISGNVSGDADGQPFFTGAGGNDRMQIAAFVNGLVIGDGAYQGAGGEDIIGILPAGVVGTVMGDFSANGAKDTITIAGRAGHVYGDFASNSGGNDTIAITNGAVITFDVVGDNVGGPGGNDFIILRGSIGSDVNGDMAAAGGNDFLRVYPAANIVGDVNGDMVTGVGGADTIVVFAGATIGGSIRGDKAAAGGADRMSISGNITGSVHGDGATAGSGAADSIGIGVKATINGNLLGDVATVDGGIDTLDISGKVLGRVAGDSATGNGAADIIYVRATATIGTAVGPTGIAGDDAGGTGGDDLIVLNRLSVVYGDLVGDNATGAGGDDTIIVSGTVNGDIFADNDPAGSRGAGGAGGSDSITIFPAGVVNGDINAEKGVNTIEIWGTVNGDVNCSVGTTVKLVATGSVTGTIDPDCT